MSLQQIDFSKVINDEQVYDYMMANYDQLGKDWINHQWRWMNAVYQAFKDHYKYMIIISLVENCLLYTSPSPRDATLSRMPSSA